MDSIYYRHLMDLAETSVNLFSVIAEEKATFHADLMVSMKALAEHISMWKKAFRPSEISKAITSTLLEGRKIVEILCFQILNASATTSSSAVSSRASIEAMINQIDSICRKQVPKSGLVPTALHTATVIPPNNTELATTAARISDPMLVCSCMRTVKELGNFAAHADPTDASSVEGRLLTPMSVFESVNCISMILANTTIVPKTAEVIDATRRFTTTIPDSPSPSRKQQQHPSISPLIYEKLLKRLS